MHYDSRLSRPFNMTYTDLTSNSVKLLFSFNETNADPRRRIQKLEVCILKRFRSLYLIILLQVHYEGIQTYTDGLGIARSTSHHNTAGLIALPPTQGKREWLVTSLQPNTHYTLNLTGTIGSNEQSSMRTYSQPAMIQFTTDFDAPSNVDRPEQDRRNASQGNDQQVYLRLHRASTKNGPIDRYYLIVYLTEPSAYQTYLPQEVKLCSYERISSLF